MTTTDDDIARATPRTQIGRSTIHDFEAYVENVPTNSDFAIGGLLDALRKDRQSALDQIRGAVLAIERTATPQGLDVELVRRLLSDYDAFVGLREDAGDKVSVHDRHEWAARWVARLVREQVR